MTTQKSKTPIYHTLNYEAQVDIFERFVHEGQLKEVTPATYSEFVNDYIKAYSIPCDVVLDIKYYRKRVGAAYRELNHLDSLDGRLGLQSHTPANPEYEVSYGWIEDEQQPGVRYCYLNPNTYPTWFHQNVVRFPPQPKE